MPFFEDVEDFLEAYTMTMQTSVADELGISGDILEETLLKMAGVATQPTNCLSERLETAQIKFTITGLTDQDDQAFATFFNEPGCFTKKDGKSEFVISEAMAQQRLLPAFQAWVREHLQTEPANFKKYLNPLLLLPLMCNTFMEFQHGLSPEIISNETDLTRIKERLVTLNTSFGIAINFLGNADAVFRGVRQKPLQEFCEDLRELGKDPAIQTNAALSSTLAKLTRYLDLCLIGITPIHYLQPKHHQLQKDPQGNLIRFFSRPMSDDDRGFRCLSDNEDEVADNEDEVVHAADHDASPIHSDAEEQEIAGILKPMSM